MNNLAMFCIGLYMLIVGIVGVFHVTVEAGGTISVWAALIGGFIVVVLAIIGWARKQGP